MPSDIPLAENTTLSFYAAKLAAFRSAVLPADSILILTHDYPDPDCIAAAYGVSKLLAFWGAPSTVISFGGFVGRAENRAMIRFLNINTVPFMLIEIADFQKIIVVDVMPGGGNVSLPSTVPVHAVFDHHLARPPESATYFYDVRSDIGATSTMITQYLRAAECPIPVKLATALFYGIKTDTRDMGRDSAAEDLECYKLLLDIMDHKLLARIERPDRDPEFFRVLHRTAEATITYGNVGYAHLGTVVTPDSIAEMADLFHSLEKLEWMVCSGVFRNIFFSIRSKTLDEAGKSAEKIATMLGGSGGGHGKTGAGRIPLNTQPETFVHNSFIKTFKEVFGISDVAGENIL